MWDTPSRMQKLLCLFLFVIVPALAMTTPPSTPSNCIVGCKCQEEISYNRKLKILDCNSPLVLTNTVLGDITKKINTILFKNVVITKIENTAFKGFNDLELVLIEDSSVGAIDPLAFDLPELGTISFTRTTFGEVPSLDSAYLEELIFNDCKLTEVPKLENLPALDFLSVANNNIKNIDEMTFVNLSNLDEVTLSNNSISKLPINLFVYNSDLHTLNADYNPLESFQLNLTSELELLTLKSCKISIFDSNSAKTLDSLTSLTLSGNKISMLPFDTFDAMKSLNYIDLSDNNLIELDDNIFYENNKLDRIILDNNNFETLPNFQTENNNFRTNHFSCKNCNLKSLNNVFDNMKSLTTIDLSDNKLTNIDGVFTNMFELRILDLSHNNISTVGINSFGNNRALEELHLSYNPLKPLDPVVFANIPSIKTLDVSNSNLTKLWTNQNAVLPSLEELFIGKNNLTVITSKDLQLVPKLKILDLKSNPLQCSVELDYLVKYLINKPIYSIEKRDLFKTHEEMNMPTSSAVKQDSSWKELVSACPENENSLSDNEDDNEYLTDVDEDDEENELYDEDDIDDDFDEDINRIREDVVAEERNLTLARASWILSVTSVFVFTALSVLTVAVVIILLVLKKNKSFNVNNDNLPRLKIPMWKTTLSHKRHSGSIYKPLSEDLSGPRTPIINRYEFKQTPQVHNSLP